MYLSQIIPIFRWLPNYPWKENLWSDFIAGLTLSSIVLPQSLAYTVIIGANLPLAYGLYTSLWPVVIYGIFGTSKHLSVGTFSLTSIMLNQMITTANIPNNPKDIANALMINSITVGTLFLFSSLTGITSLLKYVSSGVISGFTTAVALYTITSQIDSLFGINFPRFDGFFSVYHKYSYLVGHIHETCAFSLSVGISCIIFLTLTSYFKKISGKQFPDVIFVVMVSTFLLNMYPDIYQNSCIGIIGEIPSRLPKFVLPDFLVPYLIPVLRSSVTIAIITGIMNITLVKTIAKTFDYEEEISDWNEMFAYSLTCLIGPFFESFLPAGSLSRSMVLATLGAKSSLASIFSVPFLVLILLFFTEYLKVLPKPILAAVIVVALQNVFQQILLLKVLWKENRIQFVEWMVTFFGVVILDTEYGLLVGLIVSLSLVLNGKMDYEVLRRNFRSTNL